MQLIRDARALTGDIRISRANSAEMELVRLLNEDGSAFLEARTILGGLAESGLGKRCEDALRVHQLVFQEIAALLPRDIVHCEDPVAALRDMIHHCEKLTLQLSHQEKSLASSTFEVAHGIDQRIRREFRNISRLNEGLDSVRFGSIRAIRIRYLRKQGMEEVLKVLKDEGAPQRSLFADSSGKTFADALNFLYEEKMGRKFTGQSLLDYRQYMDLTIQVRRLGSDAWESVDSSKLSTGESIGVGLSILIMVLQSWEEQTSRMIGRTRNSSRFLFLDEASRLDSSSINTLSVLCRDMQLQLLIAAPSADKAICGTTYCLNRIVDQSGREMVVVRGMRGFSGTRAAADDQPVPVEGNRNGLADARIIEQRVPLPGSDSMTSSPL
jgi:chromosome partition protein MukB